MVPDPYILRENVKINGLPSDTFNNAVFIGCQSEDFAIKTTLINICAQ
jgi:hypothetical protein